MALYLTPREVAERWNCSASHVRRLCRTGELPAMRLGVDWRFSLAAVEAYEQRQTTTATDATDRVAMRHPVSHEEVTTYTTTVDGFTLPAEYRPVFPELWTGHEPRINEKRPSAGTKRR